jgi:hypothetical protein
LQWSNNLDYQNFALRAMVEAGINVVTMSSWGERDLGCIWAQGAPMQIAPKAHDELFNAAAEHGLLIMPLIESRGDWSFRDEYPRYTYPDGRVEVAPGTVGQIKDLISRYLTNANNPEWRDLWARVYDRRGESRYAVVIIQAGSSVLSINDHEAFAAGFDLIADEVFEQTKIKIGFLIDALPADAAHSPARTTMRPTPEDTGPFLFESNSILGIQCFAPEVWLGTSNEHKILDWKESFSRRWYETGIPFLMDVSPGYDNRYVFPDNVLVFGDNLPWRTTLSEMVERYGGNGIVVNSWNGYTEAMVAVPTREFGDAFYIWLQAINRKDWAMSATFRMVLLGRRGRCVENLRAPQINRHSVILISVSEAIWDSQQVFSLTPEQRIRSRFVGAADIAIKNISPSDGRVDFVVSVDWAEPLNIVVDIVILDPPVETILGM